MTYDRGRAPDAAIREMHGAKPDEDVGARPRFRVAPGRGVRRAGFCTVNWFATELEFAANCRPGWR